MATVPKDITDLYLAPVLLAVDARLAELEELTLAELTQEVAVLSDCSDRSPEWRREALLRAIAHGLALHGWTLSWDARGLVVAHGDHRVVLGLPPVANEYLSRTAAAPQ